jgi:hypothetical protein
MAGDLPKNRAAARTPIPQPFLPHRQYRIRPAFSTLRSSMNTTYPKLSAPSSTLDLGAFRTPCADRGFCLLGHGGRDRHFTRRERGGRNPWIIAFFVGVSSRFSRCPYDRRLGLVSGERAGDGLSVLILGVLHLANIPFGTAIGIYTLWALLNEPNRRLSQRRFRVSSPSCSCCGPTLL